MTFLIHWTLVLLLAPQLTAPGNALPQVLNPEYKSRAAVKAGGKTEITLGFKLLKGFAINHTPPRTHKLTAPTGVTLDNSEFTKSAKDPKSKDE
jgi:hypothetical protein